MVSWLTTGVLDPKFLYRLGKTRIMQKGIYTRI